MLSDCLFGTYRASATRVSSPPGYVPRLDAKRGNSFLQADFRVRIRTVPILDYFRIADHPRGISVSLEVEHKQFIGTGNSSALA